MYAQGSRPGDIIQITYTNALPNAGWCHHDGVHKWLGASPLATGSGAVTPSERQLEMAKACGTTAWFARADYLARLAQVAQETGFDLRGLSTRRLHSHLGTDLEGHLRTRIEDAWGAPVYDNYGSHEIGPVAFECEVRDGMHISEDTVYIEFADVDTDAPLAWGERGNLIATSLHRGVPPIIRYNMRDCLAGIERRPCACGLETRKLSMFLGRSDEMVKLRGTNVYPGACQSVVVEDKRTTGEFLCVARHVGEGLARRDAMTVRVERRSPDIDAARLQADLTAALHRTLGAKVDVEIVESGTLRSTPDWIARTRRSGCWICARASRLAAPMSRGRSNNEEESPDEAVSPVASCRSARRTRARRRVVSIGPASAQAPAWPTKPVHIVVPFPPGGTTDIIGRAIGDELSKSLGQPVVIDNKPGANTNIGAAFVARAAPDGYTLLVASPSVTTNPGLYRALDYDTARDLTGVSLITEVPLVMVIHPAIPATTVAEVVAYVKASGKPLSCGSTGSGSLAHLSCILLKNSTGMDVLHVPYKGGAPMVNDLLGGQVDTVFDAPATTLQHIQAGKMRALATTGPRRIASLSNLPTMKESGYDGFEVVWWAGVLAPAGTPAPIVERLNGDVARALDSSAVAARFAPLGMGTTKESAESFTARIRNDTVRWGKVFRDAGVTID